MIKFFKSLFGSEGEAGDRILSHPRDLKKGDFLKFQRLSQPEASDKTFEVFKVNTYKYHGVNYPEMILKDRDNETLFLMIEEEDGEEYIALSKKVPKSKIREIIPQDGLDRILKDGTGSQWEFKRKDIANEFKPWIAERYTETDEDRAIFAKGDDRHEQTRQDENFRSYTLTDDSDEYAIEIEVYGNNELEMSVTVYHSINVIEEILPGREDRDSWS